MEGTDALHNRIRVIDLIFIPTSGCSAFSPALLIVGENVTICQHIDY
jgi:hypothetical protein